MAYSVRLTKRAAREFKRLDPPVRNQLLGVLGQMERNPFTLDTKTLQKPLYGYRTRSGKYRLLYTLEKKVITVYAIRHRRDAYR